MSVRMSAIHLIQRMTTWHLDSASRLSPRLNIGDSQEVHPEGG